MSPSAAFTLIGVVLLFASMISAAWALRWLRRRGRLLAGLHASAAVIGVLTGLRGVARASESDPFYWLRVTDVEVVLLVAYIALQAAARTTEIWREWDREVYAAKLRHALMSEEGSGTAAEGGLD